MLLRKSTSLLSKSGSSFVSLTRRSSNATVTAAAMAVRSTKISEGDELEAGDVGEDNDGGGDGGDDDRPAMPHSRFETALDLRDKKHATSSSSSNYNNNSNNYNRRMSPIRFAKSLNYGTDGARSSSASTMLQLNASNINNHNNNNNNNNNAKSLVIAKTSPLLLLAPGEKTTLKLKTAHTSSGSSLTRTALNSIGGGGGGKKAGAVGIYAQSSSILKKSASNDNMEAAM